MTRTWFLFLQNLFNLTGGGSNPTSLTDLQVVPSITTAEDPSGVQALQEVGTLSDPVDLAPLYAALQGLSVGPPAAAGSVVQVNTGTGLTGGPIVSVGTISLADTAVTPGSYTLASITVDQQGRLTAAADGAFITAPVAVASLPAAGTAGLRSMVNDADTPVFGDVVIAGGAAIVPVYDDGTDWRVG